MFIIVLIKVYNDVVSTLLLHDKWRREYNGDRIGLGMDEYCKDQLLEYPESYAKFAIGYKILYDLTNDDEYKNIAINSLDWL